jgi:phosphoglycerol transferase MdoB-like AlkP superfamily enzyme
MALLDESDVNEDRRITAKRAMKRLWMILLLSCFIFLVVTFLTREWKLIAWRAENRHVVNQLGLVGYTVYDIGSLLLSKFERARINSIDTTPYAEFLAQQRSERNDYVSKNAKRKNVIYLQLESVDGFCLWADYQGAPLMPRLREIAKSGVAFSNTIDVTHAGRTVDAELLTLTSLIPIRGNPVFVSYDLSGTPSIPRVLREEGYYTFSAHGYEGFFWNRAEAHRALGFERDFFKPDFPTSELIGWGVPDEDILAFALDEIKSSEVPVFAHIILLTHHHPYNYVGEKSGKRQDSIEENYIVSLQYVDAQIGKFYDDLRSSGELANTILAIYSDHDGGVTSSLAQSLDFTLTRLGDAVPFVILGLDAEPRVDSRITGLQDLPVIVLNDLGIRPPTTFVGNSLSTVGRTISFDGNVWRFEGESLVVEPLSVDSTKLTKLSILRPNDLEEVN